MKSEMKAPGLRVCLVTTILETNHEIRDEGSRFKSVFSNNYFRRTMVEEVKRSGVLYPGGGVAGCLGLYSLYPWGATPKGG